MSGFFAELRKRKIWWVAGVYVAAAWVAVQVVGMLETTLGLPAWMDTATVIFLAVGFPVAIILAWAQETQAGKETGADDVPDAVDRTPEPGIEQRIMPTLAVLPFDNFTNDEELGHLADGISEDIITSLSYDPVFDVRARNSSFQFRGSPLSVSEIGKQLGVNFVIEGSVRTVGETLRITAQLVETATDSHIWADRMDEPLADIASRQDAVMAEITSNASEAVHSHIVKLLSDTPEEELPAVGFLFRAFEVPMTERGRRRELMTKAIEKEPDAPQYRAALNTFIAVDYSLGFSNKPEADREEVIRQGEALLRLAPSDGAVLNATGMAWSFIGRFEEGLLLSRQAWALSPDRWSRENLANALLRAGHLDEAIEHLDALTEKGIAGHESQFELKCRALICKGDLEGALEIADILAVHLGHVFMTWLDRASILACLGRMDEARECVERLRRLVPQFTYEGALNATQRNYAVPEHQERIARGFRLLLEEEESG